MRGSLLQPPALVVDRVFGHPLAAKPTHDSLLRCRWAPGTIMPPRTGLLAALGVARALSHLHSLGICHGDVYAHNVLADDKGHAVLCDYGARTCAGCMDMEHCDAVVSLLRLKDTFEFLQSSRHGLVGKSCEKEASHVLAHMFNF